MKNLLLKKNEKKQDVKGYYGTCAGVCDNTCENTCHYTCLVICYDNCQTHLWS